MNQVKRLLIGLLCTLLSWGAAPATAQVEDPPDNEAVLENRLVVFEGFYRPG